MQMLPGNGKFNRTGLGTDRERKEAVDTAFNFLKANGNRIRGSLGVLNKDFVINYQDLQGIGMTHKLALPTLLRYVLSDLENRFRAQWLLLEILVLVAQL